MAMGMCAPMGGVTGHAIGTVGEGTVAVNGTEDEAMPAVGNKHWEACKDDPFRDEDALGPIIGIGTGVGPWYDPGILKLVPEDPWCEGNGNNRCILPVGMLSSPVLILLEFVICDGLQTGCVAPTLEEQTTF